jgi:ATP-dependent Lhr-like helicase
LNLVGILLPGARIPALTGNRILYRDGVPVGAVVAGEVTWLMPIDAAAMREAEDMLIRTRADLTPAIAEGSVPDAA